MSGGNAAPGGNGGNVSVSVPLADLPLLVLAEVDAIGGAAAQGGRGGDGGIGGEGGVGGRGQDKRTISDIMHPP